MRRILIALLCVLLLTGTALAAEATVTAYDTEVTVQTDGSADVKATMTLHITGTLDELLIPLGKDASACSLGGEEFTKKTVDGVVCLLVQSTAGLSGDRSFTVTYTLPSGVSQSGSGQTYRLKLLAPAWAYAIDKFSAKITLPQSFTATPQFISGYYGENVDNYMDISVDNGVITAKMSEKLHDHEELRLQLELPADYFDLRYQAGRAAGFCKTGFVLLLVLCLLYWFARLRNPFFFPAARRLPPLFANAGEVGYQITCDSPDLPLLTVQWATMGYLSIYRNRNGRVILRKKMEMGNERKRAEQRLFAALFAGDGVCDVQSMRFRRLSLTAKRTLSAYWGKRLFRKRSGNPYVLRMMAAFAGAFVLAMTYDAWLPETAVRWIFILLLTAVSSILLVLLRRGLAALLQRERTLPVLMGVGAMLVLLFLGARANTALMMLLAVLLECFAAAATLFGGQRSPSGMDMLQQLLGFRLYLRGASRSQMLHTVHRDRQFYYSTLPLADAMGLAKSFTAKFNDYTLEACPWLDAAEGVSRSARGFYGLYTEVLRAMRGKEAKVLSGRSGRRQSSAPRRMPPVREPVPAAAAAQKPHVRPHRRPEYDVDYNEFGEF